MSKILILDEKTVGESTYIYQQVDTAFGTVYRIWRRYPMVYHNADRSFLVAEEKCWIKANRIFDGLVGNDSMW